MQALLELLHVEAGLAWVEATAKKRRRRRLVSEKEMIRLSVSFFFITRLLTRVSLRWDKGRKNYLHNTVMRDPKGWFLYIDDYWSGR
jgi:hypothetical protein